MKRKTIVFGFCLLMAGSLALSSCMKNNGETIVLVGPEYYVDYILDVIPDSLYYEFYSCFGDIPDGPVPDSIEGSYLVAPKLRVKTNVGLPVDVVEPDVTLCFKEQNNGVVTLEMIEYTQTETDTAFVMGNGNDFTVYTVENKSYDLTENGTTYHVTMQRGLIMAGKKDHQTNGLADFRMATIVLANESTPPGASLQPVGSYFIYKDGDGMAEFIP